MMTRKKIIKPNYVTLVKRGLLAAACCGLLVYIAVNLATTVRGPVLTLAESLPVATTQRLLTLSGSAIRAQTVTVNGKETPLDIEQNFSLPLLLMPGYNVVTVEAKDQFGKSTRQVHEIVRTPQSTASQN